MEPIPLERRIFCNRTLNLRAIRAIGYDLDYTLVHYRPEVWERTAYEHLRQHLVEMGWPVGHLEFRPTAVIRGLIIDTELGNLIKANRFGFVKKAEHGTRPLDWEEQRRTYARTIVDLSEPRWVFINTLFSLSEGCLYAQLVDMLDERKLPGAMGYADLYRRVRTALDETHMAGKLKAEILGTPERFVVQEPEVALALLDQKHSGKKLLLITNSEWAYTAPTMRFAFDPFLPRGKTWRDLFDVVIVGARKPEFFTTRSPLFEVVSEEGLLKPCVNGLRSGAVFLGGSASHVEKYLGASGDEILYVGDHMFGDVHVTKDVLRWRTALILRELEEEIRAVNAFRDVEARISSLMSRKEELEAKLCATRLAALRRRQGYGPEPDRLPNEEELSARGNALRSEIEALDQQVAPLAKASTEQLNTTWGLLMRAGNDKSHFARQMERYADVYTSRVANLLYATPFAFLRSPRGNLPHDPAFPDGHPDSTTREDPTT